MEDINRQYTEKREKHQESVQQNNMYSPTMSFTKNVRRRLETRYQEDPARQDDIMRGKKEAVVEERRRKEEKEEETQMGNKQTTGMFMTIEAKLSYQ